MVFKIKLFFVVLLCSLSILAQNSGLNKDELINKSKRKGNSVKLIQEDDLQSTYLISIIEKVERHFHKNHTENIFVLDGRALMTLGDKNIKLKKGKHVNIPKGTPHSVEKVFGKKPLIVVSVQAPKFDKSDRIKL